MGFAMAGAYRLMSAGTKIATKGGKGLKVAGQVAEPVLSVANTVETAKNTAATIKNTGAMIAEAAVAAAPKASGLTRVLHTGPTLVVHPNLLTAADKASAYAQTCAETTTWDLPVAVYDKFGNAKALNGAYLPPDISVPNRIPSVSTPAAAANPGDILVFGKTGSQLLYIFKVVAVVAGNIYSGYHLHDVFFANPDASRGDKIAALIMSAGWIVGGTLLLGPFFTLGCVLGGFTTGVVVKEIRKK